MGNREQYAVDLSLANASEPSLESALLRLATEFLNLPVEEIGNGIEQILAVIGGFSGADCSGVSELDRGSGQMRELHTWTKPGCAERSGAGEAVDVTGLAELFGDYDRSTLVSDAIEDPRFPDGVGQAFADFGVRSLAWVPLSSDERSIVAVGFTSAQPIEWSEDQIAILEVAGKMISNLRAKSAAITELRQTELLLEDLGRSIGSHFFMCTIDPPRFLYSNDAIDTLSGWPTQRFKTEPFRFLDILLPEYRRPFAELFETGQTRSAELEYAVRHADGSIRWLRTRVFPGINRGSGGHVAGLTEDITESVAFAENEAQSKALETMLNRTSGRLFQSSGAVLDAAIDESLAEVCQFADVELGHVYLFDPSLQTMREISRWQSVAELASDEGFYLIPRTAAPHFIDSILAGRCALDRFLGRSPRVRGRRPRLLADARGRILSGRPTRRGGATDRCVGAQHPVSSPGMERLRRFDDAGCRLNDRGGGREGAPRTSWNGAYASSASLPPWYPNS